MNAMNTMNTIGNMENMEKMEPSFYNEEFIGETFKDGFKAKNYICCEFKDCIFADTPAVNNEVKLLLNSNNTLINCWYNPSIIFANILATLNDNVNIIDALNKAWIKNDNKRGKETTKQLILLDINQRGEDAK
jgi:hypothetical protein